LENFWKTNPLLIFDPWRNRTHER